MSARRFAALARALLLPLLLLCCLPARAHKPSDSYLTLRLDGERIEARWDIALRDLDFAIGVDGDGDGRLTWDEIRARHGAIAAYALARLQVDSELGACALAPQGGQLVEQHGDGAYTVLRLQGRCTARPARLTVHYRLFADTDAQHRGLLGVDSGGAVRSAILGGDQPRQVVELAWRTPGQEFLAYLRHGVWHIWIGFDHILFLVSLLLPAVLIRQDGAWQGVPGLRTAGVDVLKTVTAFTLAHSVTLTLAALGMLALPTRWVESAIAASVVVAALNNVVPVVQRRRWLAAFLFGLVHGFGFAGVLAELGLPRDALALALVGFNVGVELGQLAIVAVVLPLAFAVRGTRLYRRVLLPGGSVAIALVACAWLAERALDWQLPPLFGAA